MITKTEIEQMLAALPEAQERMREVLQLAFVAGNLCGVEEDYYRIRDELARARNRVVDVERDFDEVRKDFEAHAKVSTAKRVELERSRDDWKCRYDSLKRQADAKITELEAELQKAHACLGHYRFQAMWEEPSPSILKFDGGHYRVGKRVIYLPDLVEKKTTEQQLSEECSRLCGLLQGAEEKIKALTSPPKTA